MLFSSLSFLLCFLPGVTIVYYVFVRQLRIKNAILTFSSLFFYAFGEPRFVLVMLLSILLNWAAALLIVRITQHDPKSKFGAVVLATSVVTNILLLVVFKYLNFTIHTLNLAAGKVIIPQTNIILPIGISFFTFQAMSYVVDVYRNPTKAQRSIGNVALYISFFPQLIAGPIVRYSSVSEAIAFRKESFDDFSEGICRFVRGLAKKVLLANSFAYAVDSIFAGSLRSGMLSWMGALFYAFQIFYDFSGYSDMAIGLGLMFGFRFDENFNYPYYAKSLTDFWRRWHISLSTWFRDYLYIPLGGSKTQSKMRWFRNLMIVWTATGIWHGANWTFLVWGILYGLILAAEKTIFRNKGENFTPHSIYRVVTIVIILMQWVMFRSDSVSAALHYYADMLLISGNRIIDARSLAFMREYWVFTTIALLLSVPWNNSRRLLRNLESRGNNKVVLSLMYSAFHVMLLLVCIALLVQGKYNPFIYFNF